MATAADLEHEQSYRVPRGFFTSGLSENDPAVEDAIRAELRREQFSLRMQKAQGQSAQTHQFARVRREIARAATILGQKQNGAA